ncbi:MAG TPA: hypothetical protein PJ993_00260 [Candidatus Saccharibacteria bacterium]|nr:hypothetical protein [Candidatus Saccharibacteria bacterium]HMT39358.1 hypothetical protein [Candidatus Saccharibacteria bacterium]
MPLFKIVITILYSLYVAWWAPRLMSQLRYAEPTGSETREQLVADWVIDKMMPRVLWAIYLTMGYAMISAENNREALVYLLFSLCVSVFLLMKPRSST